MFMCLFSPGPNFIVMESPKEKQRFGTIFRKCYHSVTPLQNANFILKMSFRRISEPMVCQSYGLRAGRLSRKRRKSRKRRTQLRQLHKPTFDWWVPNPPFANPVVAEKAPWWFLQSGVAGVDTLLELPTDSYHFPTQLTPSSEPSSHSHGRRFQLPKG